MRRFVLRTLALLVAWVPLVLILMYVPVVNQTHLEIHGFGWVVFGAYLIGSLFVGVKYYYPLLWRILGSFGQTVPGHIVGRAITFTLFPAGLILLCVALPSLFTIVAPLGQFLMLLGLGISFTVGDLLEKWVDEKTKVR